MRDYLWPILVCGGRDYADPGKVYRFMDGICDLYGGDIVLITGAARGADLIAEDWAKSRQQVYVGFPAQWDRDPTRKKAGMERNAEMAAISQAAAVVVFRGGRGTLGMLSLARNMEDPVPFIFLPDGEFWK